MALLFCRYFPVPKRDVSMFVSLGLKPLNRQMNVSLRLRDMSRTFPDRHGYIHKLRRALRHDTSISIINQRGFGYMLVVK